MKRTSVIWTIGHSTRTAAEFLSLLQVHEIDGVADVRTIPRSRRHPHFSSESLSAMLSERGMAYVHLPGLGGLRKPVADSSNGGWRNEGFRGYADHMQTLEFRTALDALLTFSCQERVAVMCAEAKWWQCHRQLIADALAATGMEVRHILSAAASAPHELTPFARVTDSTVSYPALI